MFKGKVFFVFLSTGTKIHNVDIQFFWKFKKILLQNPMMSLTKLSKMEKENYTNTLFHRLIQYSSDSEDERVSEKRTGIIWNQIIIYINFQCKHIICSLTCVASEISTSDISQPPHSLQHLKTNSSLWHFQKSRVLWENALIISYHKNLMIQTEKNLNECQ